MGYPLCLMKCLHLNKHFDNYVTCISIYGQTICPKIIGDVHLQGQKQQQQQSMFISHVCQPPYLCSFVIQCISYW